MTQEEEITQLKKQLREVLEQLGTISEQLSQIKERESQLLEQLSAEQTDNHLLQETLAAAHKRIEELEKQKTPPPSFVKANVKKSQAEEKQPRKKRDSRYNRARRREEPTLIVEHLITSCPVCRSRLGGVSVARRRPRDRVAAPTADRGDRACGLSWLV
jgi:DNA repair exonuclease SbcCD ATPase subunit